MNIFNFKIKLALANTMTLEPEISDTPSTSPRDGYHLALHNAASLDDEGWALIAPFGEHPKTRLYRENGVIKQQKFIQVLDNTSADAMLARENSFFRSLKRALVGIPVYKDHGDLTEVDPQAVSNDTTKIKLGVIDRIRKTARGIEAHFALDNDGADAVAAGWKLPSALWWVLPVPRPSSSPANNSSSDTVWCRPFKLISVALTRYPNISGVESLANGNPVLPPVTSAAAKQTQNHNHTMKELLIGWLAAQGVPLANDATDQSVFAAFTSEMSARHTQFTALGNEKNTLATVTVPALTRERDDYKKKMEEATVAQNSAGRATNLQFTGNAPLTGNQTALTNQTDYYFLPANCMTNDGDTYTRTLGLQLQPGIDWKRLQVFWNSNSILDTGLITNWSGPSPLTAVCQVTRNSITNVSFTCYAVENDLTNTPGYMPGKVFSKTGFIGFPLTTTYANPIPCYLVLTDGGLSTTNNQIIVWMDRTKIENGFGLY